MFDMHSYRAGLSAWLSFLYILAHAMLSIRH